MAKEDEDLVRAAQRRAGPEAHRAFAALVDRWKGPVYRVAHRRLRDDHDSDEVAADTFVLAWKALHTLRSPGAFPGWILRIAARRALARLKERKVNRATDSLDRLLAEPEAPEFPLDRHQDLYRAFGEVPEDDLSLLRRKHEDGLTYREIAEEMGVSISTVRDRLVGARGRIEGALRKAGLLEEFALLLAQRRAHRRHAAGDTETPPDA